MTNRILAGFFSGIMVGFIGSIYAGKALYKPRKEKPLENIESISPVNSETKSIEKITFYDFDGDELYDYHRFSKIKDAKTNSSDILYNNFPSYFGGEFSGEFDEEFLRGLQKYGYYFQGQELEFSE